MLTAHSAPEKLYTQCIADLHLTDPGHDKIRIDNAPSYNKYYYVPYNVSGIFTGRDNVIEKLRNGCVPPNSKDRSTEQKRFVLYGLGGSGKTQTCLKFAQDYRER